MIIKNVEITNKLGLHARASAKLVELSNHFKSNILLRKNNQIANAKSIMSVMMLSAHKGTIIQIEIDGVDEENAAVAIENLINNNFGESD